MKDYFDSLFYYFTINSILLDTAEFSKQIINHPDYPSLLSVFDTLLHFNINYSTFSFDDVSKIHISNFLAAVGTNKTDVRIVYIQKSGTDFLILKDNILVRLKQGDFNSIFQGIVFTLSQNQLSNLVRPRRWNDNYLPITILLVLLLFSILQQGSIAVILLVLVSLQIIGLSMLLSDYFPYIPILRTFNQQICNMNICNLMKTSANQGVCSNFNFQFWALFLFIFKPLGILLFILSGQYGSILPVYFWVFLAEIPIILFSIYCQFYIIKVVCRKCLAIALIMTIEAIIIVIFSTAMARVSLSLIFVFLLSFALSYICAIFIYKYSQLTEISNEIYGKYSRFKRNYFVFYSTLLRSRQFDISLLNRFGIKIGSLEANLKLYFITNPDCCHCHKYIEFIKKIEKKYKDKIAIVVCLLVNIEDNNMELVNTCRRLMLLNGNLNTSEILKGLSYMEESFEQLNNISLPNDTTILDESLLSIYRWCIDNEIYYTPTFIINGYLFPKVYENEDIKYFIDDLVETESY